MRRSRVLLRFRIGGKSEGFCSQTPWRANDKQQIGDCFVIGGLSPGNWMRRREKERRGTEGFGGGHWRPFSRGDVMLVTGAGRGWVVVLGVDGWWLGWHKKGLATLVMIDCWIYRLINNKSTSPLSCEPLLKVSSSMIYLTTCPLSTPHIHINARHLGPIALPKGYPHGQTLDLQQPGEQSPLSLRLYNNDESVSRTCRNDLLWWRRAVHCRVLDLGALESPNSGEGFEKICRLDIGY